MSDMTDIRSSLDKLKPENLIQSSLALSDNTDPGQAFGRDLDALIDIHNKRGKIRTSEMLGIMQYTAFNEMLYRNLQSAERQSNKDMISAIRFQQD